MTIYTLYIFSRTGACLYYHEWHRPHSTLKDMPQEDRKLMFGLLFSLKQLMNKMNPNQDAMNAQLPAIGPENGFYRYTTDSYQVFHLESSTGYKFALTCDKDAGDLRGALWTLYSDLFTDFALKNPLYIPGTPIRNTGFITAVDGFVRSLPSFVSR